MDYKNIIKNCIDDTKKLNELNNSNNLIELNFKDDNVFKEFESKVVDAKNIITDLICSSSRISESLTILFDKNAYGYFLEYKDMNNDEFVISFFLDDENMLNILVLKKPKGQKIHVGKLYKKNYNNLDKYTLDEIVLMKNNNIVKRKMDFNLSRLYIKMEDNEYNIIYPSKKQEKQHVDSISKEENYICSALLELDVNLSCNDIYDLFEVLAPSIIENSEYISIEFNNNLTGQHDNFIKEFNSQDKEKVKGMNGLNEGNTK